MALLKVSKNSNPNSVAGAIAGFLKDNANVELQAVGAAAINQAVKAITIARGFVATRGKDIVCAPAFVDIEIEGKVKTGIKFAIIYK